MRQPPCLYNPRVPRWKRRLGPLLVKQDRISVRPPPFGDEALTPQEREELLRAQRAAHDAVVLSARAVGGSPELVRAQTDDDLWAAAELLRDAGALAREMRQLRVDRDEGWAAVTEARTTAAERLDAIFAVRDAARNLLASQDERRATLGGKVTDLQIATEIRALEVRSADSALLMNSTAQALRELNASTEL